MASKLPETDAVPNDSDGETPSLHFKKKRARRVSFADTEITSVHIFRRDDDNETSPDSKAGPPDSAENEVLGFFSDLGGGSEDSGDDDGDSVGDLKSFLRPLGSPSPGGSSTADSAASNDDDDFFGPVSSSFIRPGRFSDSGISDDIHEETMDTTAFSLHYRSLARSESEEAKTPTAVRLNFEEKTERKDANPTGSGSLMALTEPKKLISLPLVTRESVRSGEDSDDMSIVNKNPKSYDFGVISPTSEYKLGRPDQLISGSKRLAEETTPRNIVSRLEFPYLHSDTQQNVDGFSLQTDVGPRQESVNQHLRKTPVRENTPKKGTCIPNNDNNFDPQVVSSPFTLLSSAGRQSFFNTPNSARGEDIGSSSLIHANLQSNDRVKHSERMPEFKVHDHSYPGSGIKQGTENLKRRLSKYSSKSSPAGSALNENSRQLKSKYASSPSAGPEGQIFNADQKNDEDSNLVMLDANRDKTPRSTSKLGQKEATVLVKDGDSLVTCQKEPLQGSLVKELTWSSPGAKADESSYRKEQFNSPPGRSQSSATHGSNSPPIIEDIEFHHSSAKSVHISDSPLIKDTGSADVRKRGRTDVLLGDGKGTNKSPKIQRSPHFLKSGNYDSGLLPEQIVQTSNEEDKVDSSQTQKHWLETFQKISWDAGHLLLPSIDMLTFESITSLEDILDYLLNIKKYEILYSEIQSQKAADQLSLRHKKRLAETRLLLCKIAHEKAKLKLMSVKHDKLLKKTQLLKSGLQECQTLKSSYIQQSKIARRDAQLDGHQLESCSANLDSEHLVASDTMDTMKQEIKELDRKINNLSNFFQKQCNMKGDLSYDVTLASIQDHLMKRKRCRLIRQDLQLWKVDEFVSQSGQYNILLNYRGYLSQRYTLTSAPVSSIIISNQLNDRSILKNFPNMNALVAFEFVYNAEVSKRGVESKCLAQATQVTQSLLTNLLDVIEEVQMAQLEIVNLVQTNFHCLPGQHQLNLQLNFINFHSGVKVTLILDVTCLSSGTYPSDIVPCDIHIPLVTAQNLTSLSCKIKSGAETLEVGHSRILRLCRCVSQLLLQDSSSTT